MITQGSPAVARQAAVMDAGLPLACVQVGDVVPGRVTSVHNYGVFVDLGGRVTGLLHAEQLRNRLSTYELFSIGDRVEVSRLCSSCWSLQPNTRHQIADTRHKVANTCARGLSSAHHHSRCESTHTHTACCASCQATLTCTGGASNMCYACV